MEIRDIFVTPAAKRLFWECQSAIQYNDVPYDVLLLRLAGSVPALKQAFPDALSGRSDDRPTRSLGVDQVYNFEDHF